MIYMGLRQGAGDIQVPLMSDGRCFEPFKSVGQRKAQGCSIERICFGVRESLRWALRYNVDSQRPEVSVQVVCRDQSVCAIRKVGVIEAMATEIKPRKGNMDFIRELHGVRHPNGGRSPWSEMSVAAVLAVAFWWLVRWTVYADRRFIGF